MITLRVHPVHTQHNTRAQEVAAYHAACQVQEMGGRWTTTVSASGSPAGCDVAVCVWMFFLRGIV